MPKPVLRRLLLVATTVAMAALLTVMPRPGEGDTRLGVDRDTALLWVSICATGPGLVAALVALVAERMIHSVRCQCARTTVALRPLLAMPAVAVPAELSVLLRALRLADRTQVIPLELPVALCFGLLRPRLLLSTGALRGLSPLEVEAVLRHEQTHLRRHDPLRLVVVRALAEALPVLPALHQMALALPVAQELAADRVAISAVGTDALGSALLKIGDALGSLPDLPLAIGAFSALDARIDQLLGVPVPSLCPSPWSLLPVMAVLVVSPALCVVLPLPAALLGCGVLASGLLVHTGRRILL